MSELKDTLVLKVGTSTLVEKGRLDAASFARIGRQIGELQLRGYGVMLVTSAARKCLPNLGWQAVTEAWRTAIVGNMQDFLLTDKELDRQGGCEHVMAAVQAGRVAITNAHDAALAPSSPYISNDLVGARLAVQAAESGINTRFVMLSDVHGVYNDIHDESSVLAAIHNVDEHRHLAGGVGTAGATGGMATKFAAAEMATIAGAETYIAHGRTENATLRAMAGEIGTRFVVRQQYMEETL